MKHHEIDKLLNIMQTLRDPKMGCDWDKAQTFKTIVPHTVEEAYEVADAIERDNMVDLKDELGDLLFQVIFYAQMAKEQGLFDFNDVVEGLNNKLVRRHPHVFSEQKTLSDEELEQQWQAIKDQEKAAKQTTTVQPLWGDIPKVLPALTRAKKVQKRAANLGFDWPNYHGALEKVAEEVAEVTEALAENPNSAHSAEEIGDLLFATVNVARHAKHDPEQILRNATDKFVGRFAQVEAVLKHQGKSFESSTLEEMDEAWELIKKMARK